MGQFNHPHILHLEGVITKSMCSGPQELEWNVWEGGGSNGGGGVGCQRRKPGSGCDACVVSQESRS